MSEDLSAVYRDERDTKPVDEIQARIQLHTDERGPDECWPWQGNTDKNGYPRFRMDGQHGSVTRAQAVLHGVELEADMFVVRVCGTPSCMNPEHLEATSDVNEYREEDSWVSGAEHHWSGRYNNNGSKLTEEDVVEIRERVVEGGETQVRLAEEKNITQANVSHIVHGETWEHADGPIKGGEG